MKKLHTAIFWALSLTWGLPMTLIGAVVALVLLVTGHKPKIFHGLVYFEIGRGWGGVELGAFFVVNRGASGSIKRHESGHGIQNIILGPFMPFIISIPSAVRYWYREYLTRTKKNVKLPPYDSIWFEGWATKLGDKYFKEV